ncbi:Topless-related protein 2, partial [Mucuna pruriens]
MSSLSRELVFLILQFLDDEKFRDTVHKLEQESSLYFNVKYFEEKVLAGEWDELEKYLSGFTKVDDNRYSMKIFFEIRKQKYLEALDRQDKARAVEILVNDLKAFSTFNEDLFKEITHLLTLTNFRQNEQLSKYGDTKSARNIMLVELKKLIEANPLFRDKLIFPSFETSRLRTLINQSLNWQHQLCKNPRPNPDIKTLFMDHSCLPTNGSRAPTPVPLPVAPVAKPSSYAPLGAHVGPFTPAPAASNVNALAGWMMNGNPSTSSQSPVVAASSLSGPPNQVSVLKHSRTTNLGMMDYQNNDHEQLMKRLRTAQSVDEVTYPAPPQQASCLFDDIPRTVVCTLHQGSTVTSMDFHPSLHSLLAVGCANGEISLWEAGQRERLISKPFKIWNISACSVLFQIDAHVGGVNDLAFSNPNKQLCIVTCGDDKLIKVWDLTGKKLFNFEGHGAPVYSICLHQKENIPFIFSNSVDGKIKAWLYDDMGPRVHYDAPGQWCTTMLYSADGSRLFSCGTSKDGDSFLVEWNESEGALKRTYSGFRKKSAGIVQFDTTKGRLLAAGEDNQIKFWDMDNVNVLTSTDAEGSLPSLPRLRFNKEGNLLAVTTADGGLKVLANSDGIKYLRAIEVRSYEASKAPFETKVPGFSVVANTSPLINKIEHMDSSSPARLAPSHNGIDSMPRCIERKRSLDDVSADKSKAREFIEIVDPIQCRTATLPDSMDPSNKNFMFIKSVLFTKVARLLYTNSGVGLLALGLKGIQRLWKWSRNELNPIGKATASVAPQHWQPSSGLVMANVVPDNSEAAVPCIALSKNDSYVMSACGGKISLFNMMTFKTMTTFMLPPPISTFLAFHPQDNNIVAIGMEDSTIHIYNVRVDEVKSKLKGHHKHITGLAFSAQLNILVSSGADAQLFFWSIDSWDKKKSVSIQMPAGNAAVGDTRVQFHIDQVKLLVCHETQLAIYDASKMELIRQWVPQDGLFGSISSATYSCNSQLVYATFTDGNIGVFDADTLRLRCRISSSAYLHQTTLNSQNAYPIVVTAHPQEPNQFAIGLSDGSIKVIEPRECDGRWGIKAHVDSALQNGRRTASPSTTK